MTRAQGERIIRGWQERLGLADWRIEVLWDEPAEEDENARVWRSGWYDNARLYFAKEWSSWPRERFEQTVIHELLHLCHRGLDETWNDLDGQLHRDAWTVATARWKQEVEGYVDRMAFRLLEFGGPVQVLFRRFAFGTVALTVWARDAKAADVTAAFHAASCMVAARLRG